MNDRFSKQNIDDLKDKKMNALALLWQTFLFIRLGYKTQHPLVPSVEIDKRVLHVLLGCGIRHKTFFGITFSHIPGLGTGDEIDRQAWLDKWQMTQQLFYQEYGIQLAGVPSACEHITGGNR